MWVVCTCLPALDGAFWPPGRGHKQKKRRARSKDCYAVLRVLGSRRNTTLRNCVILAKLSKLLPSEAFVAFGCSLKLQLQWKRRRFSSLVD